MTFTNQMEEGLIIFIDTGMPSAATAPPAAPPAVAATPTQASPGSGSAEPGSAEPAAKLSLKQRAKQAARK